MYFSFKNIKFSDFIDKLRNVNYWLISFSIIIAILSYVIRAMRWKILIDSLEYNIPLKDTYNAIMIGYLSNLAIPRIGEVTRCGVIKNTNNVPFEKVFGTVIVERCYDVACLIISLITVLIINSQKLSAFMYNNIWQPFSTRFASGSLLILIIAIFVLFIIFLFVFTFKKKLRNLSSYKKISNIIKGLIEGMKTAFLMKKKGSFFLFTLSINFCYWFAGFLVIKAMPETAHLTIIDALFVFVIGALGWIVPVQGAFGSYHILTALGLGLYGITYADGIVFATISHESQILFMIILGIISFTTVFLTNNNLKIKNK